MIAPHDFEEAVKRKVKPDLNLIYTEPPFETPTGRDFGWFCREHALHLYLVSRILGLSSSIIRGNIGISDGTAVHATIDQDSRSVGEHFWCRIGEMEPVDISVTLRYVLEMKQIPIVFGPRESIPYDFIVVESTEKLNARIACKDSPVIVYHPIEKLEFDPSDLICNPFMFLIRPPASEKGWTELYGEDVFSKITGHCLKLVTGECKPVHS